MQDVLIPTARGEYRISDDSALLQLAVVQEYLARSYWAAERPAEVVERSIAGSLCFGLYAPGGAQAGFARVVTDRATTAWLCDVFVLEEHRGAELGKALVEAVLGHPDLEGLRVLLATRDAHGLYSRYGFGPIAEPGRWMLRPAAPVVPAAAEVAGDT